MANQIRQSVSWWCFVDHLMTPEQLVSVAADQGYAAIELVPQKYWQLIKDHGLAIAAVGGHESIANGLNRVENHEQNPARDPRQHRPGSAMANS